MARWRHTTARKLRHGESRGHRRQRQGRTGSRSRSARARSRRACGRRRAARRIGCGLSAGRPDRLRPDRRVPGRHGWLSFTSPRSPRPESTRRRRPSGRTCSAPTTSSKRLGCSGCAASSGRRARRSSACRSSASSPHTRRSTRSTRLIPSRATRSRRCSRRSSAGSCIAGPARRTSRCGFRTSWSPTTTSGFRPIGTTRAATLESVGLRRRARRRRELPARARGRRRRRALHRRCRPTPS